MKVRVESETQWMCGEVGRYEKGGSEMFDIRCVWATSEADALGVYIDKRTKGSFPLALKEGDRIKVIKVPADSTVFVVTETDPAPTEEETTEEVANV